MVNGQAAPDKNERTFLFRCFDKSAVKLLSARRLFRSRRSCSLARLLPLRVGCLRRPLTSFSGRMMPRQKISVSLLDHLIVRDPEVAVAAEQLLDEKIVEELHVGRRETDRRVDAVVERALAPSAP